MTEKLYRGEKLLLIESRDLRIVLEMRMVGNLKDYTRKTAGALAKLFAAKYPEALKIVDADWDTLGDGNEASIVRLYDHVNYKKPSDVKKGQLVPKKIGK